MSEKKVLFELEGLVVLENTVYTVQHRPDPTAPTGYQQFGATKLPSDGVQDVFYCRWIDHGGGRGTWDTGFETHSPMYRGKDPKEVEKLVRSLLQNILKPYRVAVGSKTAFGPDDQESIENTAFRVYDGQTFDTNNPIDVMELYFSLLRRKVVTSKNEKDSTYNSANYRIIDINSKKSTAEEKAGRKFKAIGEFQKLLIKDKKLLVKVLKFMDIPVQEGSTDTSLQLLFDNRVKTEDTIDLFLRLSEDVDSDEGKAKVTIYSELVENSRRRKDITKSDMGTFLYKGVEVGSSLKNAAINISTDSELEDIKKDILLN